MRFTASLPAWISRRLFAQLHHAGRIMLLFGFFIGYSSLINQASAQSHSVPWYKIAGGGGTSSNCQYSVSGTIGQHDVGGPLTGGPYSLTGGFWALYAVQTAGLPNLTITLAGPGSAVVS